MTVIINGTDNAVGNPAFQGGTGGTTTGVYYPAANTIALVTNGANALTISSTQAATFANAVTATGGFIVGATAAPAFSAYGSATQSILNNTATKLTLDVETFDTNSNFASNRFTPTISGYYQINGCSGSFGATGLVFVSIFKNNGEYKRGAQVPLNTSGSLSSVADVIYFNGTTDYVELFITQLSGTTQNITNGSALTYMSGCFLRSA